MLEVSYVCEREYTLIRLFTRHYEDDKSTLTKLMSIFMIFHLNKSHVSRRVKSAISPSFNRPFFNTHDSAWHAMLLQAAAGPSLPWDENKSLPGPELRLLIISSSHLILELHPYSGCGWYFVDLRSDTFHYHFPLKALALFWCRPTVAPSIAIVFWFDTDCASRNCLHRSISRFYFYFHVSYHSWRLITP